jgi:hypothetical protein
MLKCEHLTRSRTVTKDRPIFSSVRWALHGERSCDPFCEKRFGLDSERGGRFDAGRTGRRQTANREITVKVKEDQKCCRQMAAYQTGTWSRTCSFSLSRLRYQMIVQNERHFCLYSFGAFAHMFLDCKLGSTSVG